jgi:hypothetical protein
MRSRYWLATALLGAASAQAGLLEGEPFTSLTLQHDSNVFRLEDGAQNPAGGSQRDDVIRRYGIGAVLQYTLGLQRFYGGGEYRRFDYQRFDNLDHRGHELTGGLDWQLGRTASGKIELRQERRMESFAWRNDDALSLQRETKALANGKLAITPKWALTSSLDGRRLRNSLPTSKGSDVNETKATIGGEYTGLPVASAGLVLEALRGSYPERESGNGVTDHYRQNVVKLTADWKISAVSRLSGDVGRTERINNGGAGTFTGLTGQLRYDRRWSAKTELMGEWFRRLSSVEETDANYVERQGGAVEVRWQTSTRVKTQLRYERANEDYRGASGSVDGGARRDQYDELEFSVAYHYPFWLTITPSLAWERRDSNRLNRDYDDWLAGLEIELRYD